MAEKKTSSKEKATAEKVEKKKKAAPKKTTTAKKTTTTKKTKATKKTAELKKITTTKKITRNATEVIEKVKTPVEAEAIVKEETFPEKTKVEQAILVDDFLENFNWHNYQEGIDVIEDDQLKEFESLVAKNFVDTADEDVLELSLIHI